MKKKITGMLAAVAVMSAQLTAFAANTVESEAMATALVAVKSKIDIPPELSEFYGTSSNSVLRKSMASFTFEWTDETGKERLQVGCNSLGDIVSYYYSDGTKYDYSQKLPGFSGEEARKVAEEFLLKTVPETKVNENDMYVYESKDANANGYTFTFTRQHNGVKVPGNNAHVSVMSVDGELKATSLWMDFIYNSYYDTPFEDEKAEIENPVASYKQVFPAELIYTDDNKKARAWESEGEKVVSMIYRICDSSPGYVSAYTGEPIEYSIGDVIPLYAKESKGYAAADSAVMEGSLSRAETEQIDEIASLVSKEECVAYLKTVPMIRLNEEMEETDSSLWRTDKENGEYRRDIGLAYGQSPRRYVSAEFDAVRGTMTRLYNSITNVDKAQTDTSDKRANEVMDTFLEFVLGDMLAEFKLKEQENDSRDYVRIVNGIEYINDIMHINYSSETDMIQNYYLYYNHHGEFANPSDAVPADTAYDTMLELYPLEKVYIFDGEMFRLAYGPEDDVSIDALTGKPVEEYRPYNAEAVEYSDISGHWCENTVKELKEYGIAFNADALSPDAEITQADLLRLFLAGVESKSSMMSDIEHVYSRCYSSEILTTEERNDTAVLTREQAFIYMVRFAGYDTVAKLPDIYKVKYADGDMLSDGMVGYAAILSGMGIINGDGATIRPQDYITRAEALTMVYNYLTSPIR